jgi:putative component of membrane protein insertase Oxa1/YidC/SpoIIIJ protein YidD
VGWVGGGSLAMARIVRCHPIHWRDIGRTPLRERRASRSPGIDATYRNWTIVTTMVAMADDSNDG